ncbi:MAG: hypothetical protein OXG87_15665 [Gemmatimonadetes bacterium]|nr:hypothetical protein [Gemmatimonadota bacterium]
MDGLTDEQVAFYKDEGYLLIDECLPPEAYQPLVDEFDAVIGPKAREAYALGQLACLFEDARRPGKLMLWGNWRVFLKMRLLSVDWRICARLWGRISVLWVRFWARLTRLRVCFFS